MNENIENNLEEMMDEFTKGIDECMKEIDECMFNDTEADDSDDEELDTSGLKNQLNSFTLENILPNNETLGASEIKVELNSLTIHDWLKNTFKNTNSSGIQQMINAQTNDLPSLMKTIAEQKTQPDFYRFWSIIPKAGCGSGRRHETRALYEAIKTLGTPFSSEELETAYEQELDKEQPSLFKQWFGF